MNTESPDSSQQNEPWWPVVVPFVIFMIVTAMEPKLGDTFNNWADLSEGAGQADGEQGQVAEEESTIGGWAWNNPASRYFVIYSVKIILIAVIVIYCFPFYLRHFPCKLSWWGIIVGVVGAVLWIGLCQLQLERAIATTLGLPETWFAQRAAANPGLHFQSLMPIGLFFLVRFFGLVIVVPLIEELFLRGFFIRYIEDVEWWKAKFDQLGWLPLLMPSIYGVLAHPMSEAFAAATWFGLVTWLMVRTRSLWDCIMAHAITNLMLGLYVVRYEQWHLW
ncbi:MAG TPA: CAAX prenyl protease-related protein [Pirellulaceae bacterium]|nr:CAAX prenyl protease-related protein [Pirellulaceae bacterium]HMO93043.1 CAAX prenyl protease-related protein [Pirellulaceae bacterium]HMP69673.1 CAAX prenyl protease-related protein [Pirellulaceae bacterium]